jgi:hypothetical protein
MKSKIKCKFCDYTLDAWRTTKDGKLRGPEFYWQKLFSHIYVTHGVWANEIHETNCKEFETEIELQEERETWRP